MKTVLMIIFAQIFSVVAFAGMGGTFTLCHLEDEDSFVRVAYDDWMQQYPDAPGKTYYFHSWDFSKNATQGDKWNYFPKISDTKKPFVVMPENTTLTLETPLVKASSNTNDERHLVFYHGSDEDQNALALRVSYTHGSRVVGLDGKEHSTMAAWLAVKQGDVVKKLYGDCVENKNRSDFMTSVALLRILAKQIDDKDFEKVDEKTITRFQMFF